MCSFSYIVAACYDLLFFFFLLIVCVYILDVIQAPFEEAMKTERFQSMPNSYLPASMGDIPGVLLLGDAFNMRHPLTGAGMTVALSDTLMWKELLKSAPNLKDYSHISALQKEFMWRRKRSHSFVVNILAQALYALFSGSDSKCALVQHISTGKDIHVPF